MTRTYAQTRAEASFAKDRSPLRDRLANLYRRIWPTKTAANLAARTGTTQRAAELFLSGATGLSARSLEALLTSDVGLETLMETMENAAVHPDWWPEFRDALEIVRLKKDLARIEARVAQLSAGRREVGA